MGTFAKCHQKPSVEKNSDKRANSTRLADHKER